MHTTMKRIYTLLSLMAIFSAFAAQAFTREVKIDGKFNELSVSTGVKVNYKPVGSGKAKAVITGDQEMVEAVSIAVRGDKLNIGIKNDRRGRNTLRGSVTVTLTAPMITEVSTSSGASVVCTTPINLGKRDFEVDASSGSSITFNSVACNEADVESTSGSTVTISSISCNEADIECSSGSTLKVHSVKAKNLDLDASSAGSLSVSGINATRLECSSSSAASAKLSGRAKYGELSASSTATIDARSLKLEISDQHKSSSGRILK